MIYPYVRVIRTIAMGTNEPIIQVVGVFTSQEAAERTIAALQASPELCKTRGISYNIQFLPLRQ